MPDTYNVRSGYDNAGNEVWFQVFGDPNLPCTFNQLNLRTAIEDPNEANDPNYPNPPLEEFTYDFDHNLTGDGLYNYTYDAENRVIKMVPKGAPSNGDKMYESTYDYLGRRVRQVVKVWDSGDWSDDPSDGAEDRRLVYYQHLPLVEFNGDDENAVLVKYVWGPDPSPNRQGGVTIGGPGALIALRDASVPENYVCFSDGAGQPGQVVARSDGSVYAKYGYDGPRDRSSLDPCLDKPESFDDCDECSGPCFLGFALPFDGLPAPDGMVVTAHRHCGCGPHGRHPGGCDPGSICGPGCQSGGCCGPACDPCLFPQTPEDCEECFGPLPWGVEYFLWGGGCAATSSYGCVHNTRAQWVNGRGPCYGEDENELCPCTDWCADRPYAGGGTLCDGEDDVCCCVCDQRMREVLKRRDPRLVEQLMLCIEAHEAQHLADTPDGACRGVWRGGPPKTTKSGDKTESECRSYDEEADCLADLDPSCMKDQRCLKDLEAILGALEKGCVKQCKDPVRCCDIFNNARISNGLPRRDCSKLEP